MKGTVIKTFIHTENGEGQPNSFIIEGEDGKNYFAHLGDIKANEDILYGAKAPTLFLYEKDNVEFDPITPNYSGLRAIRVKKIKE